MNSQYFFLHSSDPCAPICLQGTGVVVICAVWLSGTGYQRCALYDHHALSYTAIIHHGMELWRLVVLKTQISIFVISLELCNAKVYHDLPSGRQLRAQRGMI
ncbi:hypothetical protein K435DRAFT_239449 [Dendrothele bispora CBS 962.96]|uniref:Uncharacterized protein n=1 Tax=Dendrothele bispora (strain CBS 962.96) TaxID=1314807 RepID=A0A4S8MM55_DENBC|nr:hypothetical protein K435DRAFT_239449 [Dendrothele bispora CBS 962.96]